MLILGFVLIQTIVFGIVFFVLRRLMIQNTTSAVNRLKSTDEENAQRLDEIRKKIEDAQIEYKRKSAELAEELVRQQEEGKKLMEEEKAKFLAKMREEGGRVLATAKSRAEKIDREVEKGIQDRAVGISLKIVEKALSDTMRSALHDQLVEELLREFQGLDMGDLPEDTKKIEIVHPHPLGADLKKRIQLVLEKKLGRKLEFKETLKEDMGGGLVLKIGSIVLDGSLQNVLGEVARDLKKEE